MIQLTHSLFYFSTSFAGRTFQEFFSEKGSNILDFVLRLLAFPLRTVYVLSSCRCERTTAHSHPRPAVVNTAASTTRGTLNPRFVIRNLFNAVQDYLWLSALHVKPMTLLADVH